MMINSFNNYLKEGRVLKQTPNPELSKALITKAKLRLDDLKNKKLTEFNTQFALEDAYEVIRESAQSLMALKGYKPHGHDATISFIREFYSRSFTEEDINAFDRFRILRNNSVYSAAPVTKEDSEECILFSGKFILNIEKILKNMQGN